jgi:mono/diheme cytochrome c family protein
MTVYHRLLVAAIVPLAAALATTHLSGQRLGVGQTPTTDELRREAITIFPDGRNLPEGSGTVTAGAAVYAAKCQACHGVGAKGGTNEALVGGQGTLTAPRPTKTVTSYWPYATTIFDYVRRAMPFKAPGTLTNDEVYAVTAYILAEGGIIPHDAVMNATTLPAVQMPNRNGFVADPRPAHGPFTR